MLINYFKIALRHLLRNKLFSGVTIFGLTLGFLSFAVLGLYVYDELSFDTFHPDAHRIFRVVEHRQEKNGEVTHVSAVGAQLGIGVKEQFAEVEDAIHIFSNGRATVGNDPLTRNYEPILTADSNFFQFFNYKLLTGNPVTALTQPNTLVMTEKTAQKYFGAEPALGKTIWVNGTMMEVTGVMQDPPLNSNFDIKMVFSITTWTGLYPDFKTFYHSDWTSNAFSTYVKLKPGVDVKPLSAQITRLVQSKHNKPEEFKSDFALQPLTQIHIGSAEFQANEMYTRPGINPFYIYMFISVAFLILMIACLNYMNLSTASALKRTREIGTRKSLGALKSQLVLQFTSEALVLSLFALLIALVLLQVILPTINEYTGKQMELSNLQPKWMAVGLITMLGAGLLSSLYPTFIISRVSPTAAMKKDVKVGTHTLPMRKVLIIAQFTVSIIMISSTIIIFNQIQFMRNAELGINVDNLVVIDINSRAQRGKFEAYKDEFSKLPEVSSVAVSSRVPGEWKDFPVVSVKTDYEPVENIFVGVDHDFLKTFEIELLQGRNFYNSKTDSSKVLLSKLAVEQLGLTNPIGSIIEIPSVRFGGQSRSLENIIRVEVIGVIEDFHFESMRSKMMPLILGFWSNPVQNIDYYTLRVNTTNWDETLKKFREINAKFDLDNPVEHTFLSNRFQEFYQADTLRGQVFLGFSLMSILIASLGLFALVSFSVESRTKEIGIRKVLGASVSTIIAMVAKEFLLLIVIAAALAVPVAWFFVTEWLQDFAYRIPVSATAFALAGMATLLIAAITIIVRSFRAANASLVDSLRSE